MTTAKRIDAARLTVDALVIAYASHFEADGFPPDKASKLATLAVLRDVLQVYIERIDAGRDRNPTELCSGSEVVRRVLESIEKERSQ